MRSAQWPHEWILNQQKTWKLWAKRIEREKKVDDDQIILCGHNRFIVFNFIFSKDIIL
jgi:hypothetical protein